MPNHDVGRLMASPLRRERDNRVPNIVLAVTGAGAVLSLIALAVHTSRRPPKAQPESEDRDVRRR
jgi:hypothetical protein